MGLLIASPGLWGAFTDVAIPAGLFVEPPPGIETNPPSDIDPYISGNPVCAADLDRDGWTDLLLSPTPGRLRVFMNNRDGTFREEGVERGFQDAIDIGGIAAGDFSNNGRTDVFLGPRSGSRYFLYINDGTGHFSEQAVERGADLTVSGENHKTQSIGLVDFDRDGFLDVHVAEWGVSGAVDDARHAVLLRNRGREAPGHFVNVTASSGLRQPHFRGTAYGFSSAWADFDGDGHPDLSLIGDFGTSQFWWNQGDGTFVEGRAAAGVGTDENGMGIAIGDIDRDGRLDFFVSSFDVLLGGAHVSANRLFRNLGGRKFEDVAAAWGVTDSSWGWGSVFLDANNDALLDLLVTNGYSYTAPPWLTGPPGLITDARADRTRLFLNTGSTMTESGIAWGVTDTRVGRGVAVLDFDNDGDEDLVIGNLYGPWKLYRNDTGEGNRWLRIRFSGTSSNRDGYGAVVCVISGGATQTALYAPTNAYLGQREPVLHFGLGASGAVDALVVEWPGGAIETRENIASNQTLLLVEPEATANEPPRFTLVPPGGAFPKDSELVLRVSASGHPAPVLTWHKAGVPVAGASGMELRLDRLQPADAGIYTVVASNAAGFTESAPIRITVTADLSLHSVARWWNEALLDGIRRDTPNPPVHARNLYHLSAALWDAFWAFEAEGWNFATPMYSREVPDVAALGNDRASAQSEAMSYAAYRLISARFSKSPGAASTLEGIRWLMEQYGYDSAFLGTTGDSPAAVGNRIGGAVLDTTLVDGANESMGYADSGDYAPVNQSLVAGLPGTVMADPNRWQPLSLALAITQNGIVLPSGTQSFVGANARFTTPFTLGKTSATTIALDPGGQPLLGGAASERLASEIVDVIRFSSLLDAADGAQIDISPGSAANHPLGSNLARGRPVNPRTGAPYAPNVVARGDFARVLAEFWADGPHSETPPGHWNVIFNQVSDHPALRRRPGGGGAEMAPLEWDARGYLALNGAMHDAACAAWTLKWQYDSARPISLIRYMGGLGQSSDTSGPSYHPLGLPLIPNLIEITTAESLAPGGRHAAVVESRMANEPQIGKIVLRSWRGGAGEEPVNASRVGWVLAERWMPYQKATFVTPAFPGYVSGHSTFSRAAAEVLTLLTGDPFFPGGIANHRFSKDKYLNFESGPSRDLTLQWATYQDAADQAGISRLYGGIHIASDDLAGRRMGARIGLDGFLEAQRRRGDLRRGGELVNLSLRGVSGEGERALIAGLVVGAEAVQEVLVRSVGPGLEQFGLSPDAYVEDPSLAVFPEDGGGLPVLINDDWHASARSNEIESLVLMRGAYTIVSRAVNSARARVELIEVYGQRLRNVSARGHVGQGNDVLIAGFTLEGIEPAALLIRGVGAGLAPFGVLTPLPDPVVRIHRHLPDGSMELTAENDDWLSDPRASLAEVAADRVGAFPLSPGAHDAALFVQLMPGAYTVTLSGKSSAVGTGLVEIYLVR